MTPELLTARKHKQNLYAKRTSNPTPHNIKRFKEYISVYKRLCRDAKKAYYSSKLQLYKRDSKKTWETLREALDCKSEKHQLPTTFIEDGNSITGDLNIANSFNTFFSNIGSELCNSIPQSKTSFKEFLKNRVEEKFVFTSVTPELILEVGNSLKPKNSSGIDNISTKHLKLMLPVISLPLSHVFNLSLQTGFIPDKLKISRVIPIFKSGKEDSFNNYRPISVADYEFVFGI